jgi:hypothetical protein
MKLVGMINILNEIYTKVQTDKHLPLLFLFIIVSNKRYFVTGTELYLNAYVKWCPCFMFFIHFGYNLLEDMFTSG